MDKGYDCEKCANRCAAVCDKCQIIILPDGKGKKPSYYAEDCEVGLDSELVKWMLEIYHCLNTGRAIPISAVMRYNARHEKIREE
jgi:hypothetical protein